jgi:UDP-N-acetylglucosamine 2-epimerase (non-hydrolysing)
MDDKIAIIYGTRPEFLKVFPIINEFRKLHVDICIVNTGQHDSLLREMENSFGIIPDHQLFVQSLSFTNSNLIAKLIDEISNLIHKENIQKIIAQGDTFTVLASSMSSFLEQRKFYHIEAGLRTSDITLPFPEEYNRRVVSLTADINFAPTELAKQNLLKENISEHKISLVGNSIVDMIQYVTKKENISVEYKDHVFITAHRRENIGQPLKNIAQAVKELAEENPETQFEWALHPNPNTRRIIMEVFENGASKNIHFTEPLSYLEAITKMARSKMIISDSGGIQEEAPSLQKRVLILREETERPEVITCNCGILVGTDIQKIKQNFNAIYHHPEEYIFKTENNPFGDGKASERIVKKILE